MRCSSVAVIAGVSTAAFTQIAVAAGIPPLLLQLDRSVYRHRLPVMAGADSVQTDPGISCEFFGTCSLVLVATLVLAARVPTEVMAVEVPVAAQAIVALVATEALATLLSRWSSQVALYATIAQRWCWHPSFHAAGAGGDGSYNVAGGLLGATLGYNWQKRPWVVGVEGDYALANIAGGSSTCGATSPVPHGCATRVDSVGTLRGRIGYAIGATRNWLPYVTGGVAVGELKASDSLFPASGSDVRVGWTVGAGLEVGLTQNWTARIEYLYLDLGNRQMFDVVPGVPENVSFTANIVRAGINYKFY